MVAAACQPDGLTGVTLTGMVTEIDVTLPDGRTLHVYDDDRPGALAVFWYHGTPGVGALPEPLLPAAQRLGIRWVGVDRAGYGGSTRSAGRAIGAVAGDVAAAADALGIERFGVLGSSGGGPHALACAALLPDRVVGAVSLAGLAPFDARGLDWFAGMGPSGLAELTAATQGADALRKHLETAEFDPEIFTPADHAALAGDWAWLGRTAGAAWQTGMDGMVDDDIAFVSPWEFGLRDVLAPVLLVHGADDRLVPCAHSEWLGNHLGCAELRLSNGDGHVSVLRHAESAMEWLRAQ